MEQGARTRRRGGLAVLVLLVAFVGGGMVGMQGQAAPPGQATSPTPGSGLSGAPSPTPPFEGGAVKILTPQPGQTLVDYLPGEILVLFQPGSVPTTDAGAGALVGRTLATANVSAQIVERLEQPDGFVLRLVPPSGPGAGRDEEAYALAALRSLPEVRAADLNFIRHIHAIPNDPGYPSQWAYTRISAPTAWNTAQTGGVVVAVLDTGLDGSHPEFAGQTVPGRDFVNNDNDPSDDNGHGTHVSGIIAAKTNNGVGVAGMAWTARIMPVKVADRNGGVSSATWINGLAWARSNGARVVNMSFGGPASSSVEQAAINDAWNAGLVLVASAGNSANEGNPVFYPGSYDNVLSVAATNNADGRAGYSEYNNRVDLAAPGGDGPNAGFDNWILSTIPGGYGLASGTSQAAPHVSGLAALMFNTANTWTNATVVQALQNTATDLGAPGRDDQYGYGLINAARAVAAAPGTPPSATPRPPPSSTPVPPPPSATRPPATAPPGTVPPTVPFPPTVSPPSATVRPPGPTVSPGPTAPPGCVFRDVCPSDLFYPYVAHLVALGAISGYGDLFVPFNELTRGQAAKLAVLAMGGELVNPQGATFTDVPPANPFYIYAETAALRGMVTGYTCGEAAGEPCPGLYYRPFAAVRRDQLVKIVVVAAGWPLLSPPEGTYADVPPGTPFYAYVETATARQLVTGYACGATNEPCDARNRPYYRPLATATRAQAAKIVDTARQGR